MSGRSGKLRGQVHSMDDDHHPRSFVQENSPETYRWFSKSTLTNNAPSKDLRHKQHRRSKAGHRIRCLGSWYGWAQAKRARGFPAWVLSENRPEGSETNSHFFTDSRNETIRSPWVSLSLLVESWFGVRATGDLDREILDELISSLHQNPNN